MSTELARAGGINLELIDPQKARQGSIKLGEFYKNAMEEGTDYGKLPGTQKPSLWKPGAELLAGILHLHEKSSIDTKIEQVGDDVYFEYVIHCQLFDDHEMYVGDGYGSCNSREPKYAFRWVAEKNVPSDLEITSLQKNDKGMYRIPSSANDIFGIQNTLLKMAKKRAFIDAVLTVTGASRIFTQDVEDQNEPVEEVQKEKPVPKAGTETKSEQVTTLEQLQYDFRDLTSLISKVEATPEGFKITPKIGLSKAEITAIGDIVGTYKGAKKVFEGPNLVWVVPKGGV